MVFEAYFAMKMINYMLRLRWIHEKGAAWGVTHEDKEIKFPAVPEEAEN